MQSPLFNLGPLGPLAPLLPLPPLGPLGGGPITLLPAHQSSLHRAPTALAFTGRAQPLCNMQQVSTAGQVHSHAEQCAGSGQSVRLSVPFMHVWVGIGATGTVSAHDLRLDA